MQTLLLKSLTFNYHKANTHKIAIWHIKINVYTKKCNIHKKFINIIFTKSLREKQPEEVLLKILRKYNKIHTVHIKCIWKVITLCAICGSAWLHSCHILLNVIKFSDHNFKSQITNIKISWNNKIKLFHYATDSEIL